MDSRYYPRPSGLQQFGTLPPQPSTLGMRSVPEENFKSFADSCPLFAPDTFTSDDPLISFELPTISHVQPVFDQRTIETSYKRPNYVVDEKQEEHGRNTSSNKKPRLESHPSSVKYPSDNMSTDQMLRLSAKYIKTVGTKYYCDLCYSEHNSKIILQDHLQSPEHMRRISIACDESFIQSAPHFCQVCMVACYTLDVYQHHIQGKKHAKYLNMFTKIAGVEGTAISYEALKELLHKDIVAEGTGCELGISPRMKDFNDMDGPIIGLEYAVEVGSKSSLLPTYQCTVCNISMTGPNKGLHFQSYKHMLKVLQKDYKSKYDELIKHESQKKEFHSLVKLTAKDIEALKGRNIEMIRRRILADTPNESVSGSVRGRGGKGKGSDVGRGRGDGSGGQGRGRGKRKGKSGQGDGRGKLGTRGRGKGKESVSWSEPYGGMYEMAKPLPPPPPTSVLPLSRCLPPPSSSHPLLKPNDSSNEEQDEEQDDVPYKEKQSTDNALQQLVNALNSSETQGGSAGGLQDIVKTLVRNEQDADVALKLSSALTQALLMYRLQNVGNALSSDSPLSKVLQDADGIMKLLHESSGGGNEH